MWFCKGGWVQVIGGGPGNGAGAPRFAFETWALAAETTSRGIDTFSLKPSARHNGVFWIDQEERMNDSLHVVGRRSLKKIGKDETI